MTTEKDIKALGLHTEIEIDRNITALRVPGGLIYRFYDNAAANNGSDKVLQTAAFVPYEFKEQEEVAIPRQE